MEDTGKYFTPLIVEELEGDLHKLIFPFVYRTSKGKRILVPKEFVTDYASTPRVMWWRYPKSGPWKFAAVIHDYLYSTQTLPRSEADWILRDAMKASGISARVRWEFWLAVRVGGWKPWNAYVGKQKEVV